MKRENKYYAIRVEKVVRDEFGNESVTTVWASNHCEPSRAKAIAQRLDDNIALDDISTYYRAVAEVGDNHKVHFHVFGF